MDMFRLIITKTLSIMDTELTFGTFTFSLLEWWLASCIVYILAWFIFHIFD